MNNQELRDELAHVRRELPIGTAVKAHERGHLMYVRGHSLDHTCRRIVVRCKATDRSWGGYYSPDQLFTIHLEG